jgi:hypothetical protein
MHRVFLAHTSCDSDPRRSFPRRRLVVTSSARAVACCLAVWCASAAHAEAASDLLDPAAPVDGATEVPTNSAAIWSFALSTEPAPTVSAVVAGAAADVRYVRHASADGRFGFHVVSAAEGAWPPTPASS